MSKKTQRHWESYGISHLILDFNEQPLRKLKRIFCSHDLYTEYHGSPNENRLICRKCGKIKPSWKGQKI